MREFMKRHYWTPGWLILGAILLVIGSFLGGTWAFLVGLGIGLWLAYPIIREQYDRARREGWAAGYVAARDRTMMNWEMESTTYHAIQIWVGQEVEGDWVVSVPRLLRQGARTTAGPGEGRIMGPFDSRDAAIGAGKRYIDGRLQRLKLEQEK